MSDQNPLRPIVRGWLDKIDLALKHKKPFQDDADEAMSFYDGDNAWFRRGTNYGAGVAFDYGLHAYSKLGV